MSAPDPANRILGLALAAEIEEQLVAIPDADPRHAHLAALLRSSATAYPGCRITLGNYLSLGRITLGALGKPWRRAWERHACTLPPLPPTASGGDPGPGAAHSHDGRDDDAQDRPG